MTLHFILVPGFIANPKQVASMSTDLKKIVWKRIYGCPQWSVWVLCREAPAPGVPVMLARIDVSDYVSCIDAMLEQNQILAVKVLQTLTECMNVTEITGWILKLGAPIFIHNRGK